MKKTGKFLFCIFLFLFLRSLTAAAQSPSVSATISEKNIFKGETLQLKIDVRGQNVDDVTRPELPDIPALRWLRGRTSTSTSYSIINGRASVTYAYTYSLIAEETGEFVIPPIEVEVDGQILTTDPISFSIIDRSSLADTDPNKIPDIFVEMEVDDTTPVPGQQLVANLVLYFKEGIEVATYQPSPGWKAEGFWKEELNSIQRPKATSVIRNGVRLRKATLMQYALFPTKSGTLTLSPFTVTVTVRTPRSRDPFNFDVFSFGGNQQRVQIETEPVELDVKPLPDITDAYYFGAVGNFTVTRTVRPEEALVGESIEVVTVISGSGNIPLITKPAYEFPDGFEKYQPEENSNINRNSTRISGTKTFSDVIIARNPGTYTLPEVKTAFYNPQQEEYRTTLLPAIAIKVNRDPNASTVALDQSLLSVRPVTGLTAWKQKKAGHILMTPFAWILLLLPLLVLGGGYWKSRYERRMQTDQAFARSENAYEKALSALNAIKFENIKEGYHQIHKALTGYIGDKFNLNRAGLPDHEYVRALTNKNIDPELVERIKEILDICSSISYAPDISEKGLSEAVDETMQIIKKLQKLL